MNVTVLAVSVPNKDPLLNEPGQFEITETSRWMRPWSLVMRCGTYAVVDAKHDEAVEVAKQASAGSIITRGESPEAVALFNEYLPVLDGGVLADFSQPGDVVIVFNTETNQIQIITYVR